MAKIVITGDGHEKPFEKKKFDSQRRSLFELIIVFFARILRGKRSYAERVGSFLLRKGIEMVVLTGDAQENTFTERGLRTDEDVLEFKKAIASLKRWCPNARIEVTAGNQELGYRLPLSSDPDGGISETSVQNFLQIAERERLFHSFSFGGKRFVLVPYLFVENQAPPWLEELQAEFVEDFTKEVRNSIEPVIIIAHDFESLKDFSIASVIKNFLEKDNPKIEKIFCAHNHARYVFILDQLSIKIFRSNWFMPLFMVFIPIAILAGRMFFGDWKSFGKIRNYYISRECVVKLAKIFKPITIPAPDGMFGIGGGVVVYDTETEEVTIEKI